MVHIANYNTIRGGAFLQTHSPSAQGLESGCFFTLQEEVTDPGCRMALLNRFLLQGVWRKVELQIPFLGPQSSGFLFSSSPLTSRSHEILPSRQN